MKMALEAKSKPAIRLSMMCRNPPNRPGRDFQTDHKKKSQPDQCLKSKTPPAAATSMQLGMYLNLNSMTRGDQLQT
jgi:hypothetical protein